MARLSTHVHVTDADRRGHVFGPGDEVPAWAQELITNPKAWDEAPTPEPAAAPVPEAKPAKRAAPRRKAVTADDAPVLGG